MGPDADLEWQLDRVADPSVTHVLSFSDEIAHLRQDLVQRAVGFLSEQAVVTACTQADREVIELELDRLESTEVEGAFADWWASARQDPAAWQASIDATAGELRKDLRPAGFRKRGATFNRVVSPGFVHVVALESVQDSVRISAGVYIHRATEILSGEESTPPTWVSEPACQIRLSLERLFPGELTSWPLAEAAPRAREFAGRALLPYLDRLQSTDDLLTASDRGREPLGFLGTEPRLHAALLADAGELDDAKRLFQDIYERAIPTQRRILLSQAEPIVGPLETGRNPSLSIADERLLADWISGLDDAIDELSRIVTRRESRAFWKRARPTGVDLDQTRASLHPLWLWLVRSLDPGGPPGMAPSVVPARARGRRQQDARPEDLRLGELLASYVGAVVRAEVTTARWRCDGSGEFVLSSDGSTPLLRKSDDVIVWVHDPPPTMAGRDLTDQRWDQLTRLADSAVAALTR